jgi:hypothetical protein
MRPGSKKTMERIREFPGPSPDDYANVLALNTAFIKATVDMKGPQRGRLAATPFLLFSFRERDLDWWDEALAENHQGDLMAAPELDNPKLRCIQTAALSFLWHLARRNPYATRIISGATVSWCEKIADLPLVTMLDRMAARGDLMQSRLEHSDEMGGRLLGDGTSSKPSVRRSSQLVALQSLLTQATFDNYTKLPAAACAMASPMRVQHKKI